MADNLTAPRVKTTVLIYPYDPRQPLLTSPTPSGGKDARSWRPEQTVLPHYFVLIATFRLRV